MYKMITITILLFSTSSFADSYYGWAGNCDEIIYDFDFPNGKWTVYGNSKYTQNGKEINNYFIKTDKITKNEEGSFQLHDSEYNSIVLLDLSDKDERIWGKSASGNQLYEKCSNEQAIKVISHVKENT
jgi:hypothetical protein